MDFKRRRATVAYDISREPTTESRPEYREAPVETRPARPRTSWAAAASLALGVAAVLLVLPYVFWQWALAIAIVGAVLGVLGIAATQHSWITGRGLAIIGLLLSAVAIAAALVMAFDVDFFLNDESALQRLQNQFAEWQQEFSQ
jgi:VIT1/CCC1 family predicted Fe2+/Mn2+ transporter